MLIAENIAGNFGMLSVAILWTLVSLYKMSEFEPIEHILQTHPLIFFVILEGFEVFLSFLFQINYVV